ncbi:major facilitator superfamily domain-containing protein [Tribonema minus]|uniref:Major facilitator superfamily domain-containing protein n=1 Tax=Tribonema minus TaxID=303371 RepID=A0A835ZDL8_9STRA|nr:major facilitator superfamily domain-containing protein [Tribonema minus]
MARTVTIAAITNFLKLTHGVMPRLQRLAVKYDSSYLVLVYVVLIGDTARGIIWPTLFPLVTELGGTSMTLGWTVAAFSLGRIFGSPILGYLAQRYGVSRTLQKSLAVFALGALFYALGEDHLGLMVTGQVVMGLGTSSLGVCRGYVADRSPPQEKTMRLAQLTAVQYAGVTYAGFTVTPLLGSLISLAQGNGEREWGELSASKFTTPAYILMALCLGGVCLLRQWFHDVVPPKEGGEGGAAVELAAMEAGAQKAPSAAALAVTDAAVSDGVTVTPPASPAACDTRGVAGDGLERSDSAEAEPMTPTRESLLNTAVAADPLADVRAPPRETPLLFSLLALNVLTRGAMSWHETLGAQLAVSLGAGTEVAGAIVAVFGAMGVGSLLAMKWLCKRRSDAALVMWGLLGMIISGLLVAIAASEGKSGVGIFTFFLATAIVYAVAFPVGNTAVLGYFSKVVGRSGGTQAVMLSWFGSSGSLARICFPLVAGGISQKAGPTAAFVVVAALETAGLCAAICFMFRGRRTD